MRFSLALLGAASLVLIVPACSSAKNRPAPSLTVPSTSVAPTTVTAPTAPTTSSSLASLRCHTSELQGHLGQPNPGAGQVYTPLVLRNVGTRTCTLAGYPGVSLRNAAGAQIGPPASREPGPAAGVVTLAAGAVASSAIHTVNPSIAPQSCLPLSVSLRVFPPDELDPLTVPAALQICAGSFSISRLVAGDTGVAP